MGADVRTYDAAKVVLIIGGVPISGFADGTFSTAERTSDTYAMVSGADGIVSRAKTNDFTGSLTITLAQTSPSNSYLSGLAIVDENTGAGVVPILCKDNSGNSLYFSASGWIRKPATAEFGKEISDREWVFDLAKLEIFSAGNIVTEPR